MGNVGIKGQRRFVERPVSAVRVTVSVSGVFGVSRKRPPARCRYVANPCTALYTHLLQEARLISSRESTRFYR